MITWNLDLTLYTYKQLDDLYYVVENMDISIANQIADYLKEKNYW